MLSKYQLKTLVKKEKVFYWQANCCQWTHENRAGYFLSGKCDKIISDLEHLLVSCHGLEHVRIPLRKLLLTKSEEYLSPQILLRQII